MRSLKYFIIGLVTVTTLMTSSCAKKDAFDNEYQKSFKEFQSFKSSSNNNYTYVAVERPIAFTYTETKLTVTDGQVTARDFNLFEYKVTGNTGSYQMVKEWHEIPTTLNTHGAEGFALYALDEIYSKAKNNWLVQDKDRFDIFFETNNNGIISKAGYQRKSGCTEGCFIGAEIKSVAKL